MPRSPRRARGSTGASGTVTFAAAGGNLHGTSFATVRPTFASDRLLQELLSDGVVIRATPVSTGSSPVLTALITILPVLVIGGLVIWFFRRSSGAQGRSMLGSYGKSNAKRYDGAGQRTTFADVAGIDEATDELGEIVDFLRHPDRYRRMVGRWGMSRNIGLVSALPRPGEESMFAGGGLTSQRTLQAIDDEVKRLTDDCYARALETLTEHRAQLEGLAEALLAHETLDETQAHRAAGIEQAPAVSTTPGSAEPSVGPQPAAIA